MEGKQKTLSAVWVWILIGLSAAVLMLAFAAGWGDTQMTAQDRQTVEENCELLQTIHYSRCGHEVTRRIKADQEYRGATLAQIREAFAEWSVTSFAPNEIVMSCTLKLYCPDHLVVMPDGAGVLGVYTNEYGDGYALEKQLEVPVGELTEDVMESVHLGLSFASMEEIESWLETLES